MRDRNYMTRSMTPTNGGAQLHVGQHTESKAMHARFKFVVAPCGLVV
jgi:hypothetical protein